MKRTILIFAASAMILSGCGVAKTTGKVVTAPVKGIYHTGKFAGKAAYGTGKGMYHTGKFVGNTAYGAGKGMYYVGKVPVVITDKALDTTSQVLTVTTQAVDLSGKIVTTSHKIGRVELDSELGKLKTARNVIRVFVDVAG